MEFIVRAFVATCVNAIGAAVVMWAASRVGADWGYWDSFAVAIAASFVTNHLEVK